MAEVLGPDISGVSAPPSLRRMDEEKAPMESLQAVLTDNVRPSCFSSTFQEVLFVLTATMATAMSALLSGSVTVASSFIGRDLNMTTAEITWITSACSLSSGAFLLLFGKVADLFGKPLYSHSIACATYVSQFLIMP